MGERKGDSVAWVFLALAILSELGGTLGLRAVADQPYWWAFVAIAVAYTISFTCMAVALRQLNVGVVYAIWSAIGTAAVSAVGVLAFGEHLNRQAVIGMVVLVAGVVLLVTSGSVRHG